MDFVDVEVDEGAAGAVLLVEVEFGVSGVDDGEVGGEKEEGEGGCEDGWHDGRVRWLLGGCN